MGRQWEERERRNNSQPEQNRISKRMVFRRTVILMLICGVGFFIPLAVQLWNISIRDHNFYQQKAAEQHAASTTMKFASMLLKEWRMLVWRAKM